MSTEEPVPLLGTGVSEDALAEPEIIALLFARHFAETSGRPDRAAIQHLRDHCGPATSHDILTSIRLITMGNLTG